MANASKVAPQLAGCAPLKLAPSDMAAESEPTCRLKAVGL